MLRLFSPAKINLFLRILAKRPDGYHDLFSVFQTISLGDILTIQPFTHDVLTCNDPHVPLDSSNLVLKAVHLFRRKSGSTQAFKIQLDKRIPTQAGLGGGSSNAATTLWACNQLTNARFSLETLQKWSAEIGSDVPFFFSLGTAYCLGRGEQVYPLPASAPCSLWIIKPQEGLSTSDVYRQLNFTSSSSEQLIQDELEAFLSSSLPYFNDLEKPAFEIKPQLRQLKAQLLENGFKTVLMSGSGSAFFCLGEGRLPQQADVAIFPVTFINRPLLSWYSEPPCKQKR